MWTFGLKLKLYTSFQQQIPLQQPRCLQTVGGVGSYCRFVSTIFPVLQPQFFLSSFVPQRYASVGSGARRNLALNHFLTFQCMSASGAPSSLRSTSETRLFLNIDTVSWFLEGTFQKRFEFPGHWNDDGVIDCTRAGRPSVHPADILSTSARHYMRVECVLNCPTLTHTRTCVCVYDCFHAALWTSASPFLLISQCSLFPFLFLSATQPNVLKAEGATLSRLAAEAALCALRWFGLRLRGKRRQNWADCDIYHFTLPTFLS